MTGIVQSILLSILNLIFLYVDLLVLLKAMAGSPKTKKAIAKPADKLKRPLSSFMIYSNENRDRIMKMHGFEKRQIGDIAKKIGECWKKMGDPEKAPFHEKAAKLKAAYEAAKAKAK